jgi:ubiquinone/menaquinone biosynthesis C-methylase UbiE
MSADETFQLSLEAARAYEEGFVPTLRVWAERLVDEASIAPDQRVLDIACGTGIVARTVADRRGDATGIVGLDLNEAMLTVARELRPDVEWRQGNAMELPFADGSFDVVLCQAGLMFVPDVTETLAEMSRVTRAGGTVAVMVWDRLGSQPAYDPLIEVAARHAGPDAIALLGTYFALGDLDELTSRLGSVDLHVTAATTDETSMPFPSVDAFVMTEVEATPLAERLTEEQLGAILADARDALRPFVEDDGRAAIAIRGHRVIASRG